MLVTDDASFQENMDADKICPMAFAVCHDGGRMETDRRTERVWLNTDFKTRTSKHVLAASWTIILCDTVGLLSLRCGES